MKPTVGMNGMDIREDVEWFNAANLPLQRAKSSCAKSVQRELEDYSMIPSFREVVQVNGLANVDPSEICNRLGQPLPMRDVIKDAQRERFLQSGAYQSLPRLLKRPELPSARDLIQKMFFNYAMLVFISGVGVFLLKFYVNLEHSDTPSPNYSEKHAAPIYFSFGLLIMLVAGRYLLAFFYDFTPYGLDIRNLLTLRAIQDDIFG